MWQMAATQAICGLTPHRWTTWGVLEWSVRRFCLREPRQGPAEVSWSSAFGGGLAPCRARLSGKGGPSLGGILLLWIGLSLSELHVLALNLLVLALCLGPVLQYCSCACAQSGQ